MICLFIDTTSETLVLGLVKNGLLIENICQKIINQHSIYTVPLLKQLLRNNNIKPNEVDKFLIVNGPGSWTGVRIGVTIAKVWASQMHKEVVPVSSLKAIELSTSYNNTCMTIIPANKSNYYIGIYNKGEKIIEEFSSLDKMYEYQKSYPNLECFCKEEFEIGNIEIQKVNLDIEKIVNYYQNQDSVNPHELNCDYLKKVNVEEKND